MIFRNSIQSIFRSPGKTALFTLLLFALTLALALSASAWASVAQFLDDCDDYYTTIGLVEYMGTNYPNDTVFDAVMANALTSFDTALIANDDATLLWEVPTRSFGYIEGFWRTDNYMPNRMLSVLVVGNVFYSEWGNVYSATVLNALYSLQSKYDTIVLIDEDFGTFEQGHFYLVFGEVYHGESPLLHLRVASFDNAIATRDGVEVPRMIDITLDGTDERSYVIPEDSVLVQVADTLSVTNNSLLVSGTDDLMSLLPFHQQELYIVDGRVFTDDEYAQGSRVAVISELMAARLSVSVGDTIDLSVAVSDHPGVYNSYWVADGFSYQATFTVVGIMNTVKDKSWYIYVPKSAGVPASQYPIGYTVGQAVIRNDDAANFSVRMESVVDDRFQLTIYDQGYSAVARPYQTILTVVMIVTVACFLVNLAVVVLFGFLFVYRQRETSETMLMLGTKRTQVCRYFLYSAGFISLVATATGAAAGYWLHDSIIVMVAKAAENYTLIDSRYSNGNLTISRSLKFAPDLGWHLFLSVGVIVFLGAVLTCIAFTIGTFLGSRPNQKRHWGPKKEHRTFHLGGSSVKFAVLSILRGGSRSLVVPVLAVSVVVFFGQLATTSLRYQEQLAAIYANTTIDGYYTDINGKQIGNQVLNAYDVDSLYHTGWISSLSVSISEPYYYLGVSERASGAVQDIGLLYVPEGFARESLEAAILRGPDLTGTNDIRTSPEFYYADTIFMTFIEGYDESILAVPPDHGKVNSCIISSSLMENQGIELRDTIRVAINQIVTNSEDNARIFRHYDLLVVGSYEKQGAEDTIYAPLALFFDTRLIWEDGQAKISVPSETFDTGYTITPDRKDMLQSTVFNSTTFSILDSRTLVGFKDYLVDYGYSQVHNISKVREFIVLKDAAFNNAVASVKQQLRYIDILYPWLYVLVGIIAIVVSYLLVISRKQEFAIMRGLGSTRVGTFSSFFFEQIVLCLFGTALGLAIWRFVWDSPTELHMMLTAGFIGCYVIGGSVSIMIMNHTHVLGILLDKD
jgi:ABC-type lipoprotein release transport system permease subunit